MIAQDLPSCFADIKTGNIIIHTIKLAESCRGGGQPRLKERQQDLAAALGSRKDRWWSKRRHHL
jgi:hypothetical protein